MTGIYITGYKRPECVTAQKLRELNIPFRILLHDTEQANQYVNWKDDIIVTNAAPGKFNQMRAVALNDNSSYAFFIEDDIRKIEWLNDDGTFVDGFAKIPEMLEQDEEAMNLTNIGIMGYSKTSNRMWRKPYHEIRNQFTNMVGSAYLIRMDFLRELCVDFPNGFILEDLLISLRTIAKYGSTLIDHRAYFFNDRGKETNDKSSGYGSGQERIQNEVKEMDMFIASGKYPFFSYKMRSDNKGFRIRFSKGKYQHGT